MFQSRRCTFQTQKPFFAANVAIILELQARRAYILSFFKGKTQTPGRDSPLPAVKCAVGRNELEAHMEALLSLVATCLIFSCQLSGFRELSALHPNVIHLAFECRENSKYLEVNFQVLGKKVSST